MTMRSGRILVGAFLFAAGAALAASSELPTVQSGKWILKSKLDGKPHEVTMCGNPLDKVAAAIAAARDTEKLGCSVVVRQPVPRATSVVVECQADRVSADGSRRVSKGKTELTVSAASMQWVMIDFRRSGHHETIDAARVGACD
jgi:hypothetical protein